MDLKTLLSILVFASYIYAVDAAAETRWSNGPWLVDAGNPEADDDSVYLCMLRYNGSAPSFRIVSYEKPGEGSFEITIQDDMLGPSASRTFPIAVSFDNNQSTSISAIYVSEFVSLGGEISGFSTFLDNVAHSSAMTVESRPTGRFVTPLKGSKRAVAEFRKCLGVREPASSKLINKEIYYGSRAGMAATVIAENGLDTGLAEIKIKHTRENARDFCESYVLDKSQKCIDQVMAEVQIEDHVIGNCATGEFSDAFGQRYRLEGKNFDPDIMAEFRIRSLKDNVVLDGSSASGYGTAMGVFTALCPKRAAAERLQ